MASETSLKDPISNGIDFATQIVPADYDKIDVRTVSCERHQTVRNDGDYEDALAYMEELWGAETGTPRADRLDVLATLIASYEVLSCPMDPPDPIDAIKFRMEQQGLTRKDLEKILGKRMRVSEVLNRSAACQST